MPLWMLLRRMPLSRVLTDDGASGGGGQPPLPGIGDDKDSGDKDPRVASAEKRAADAQKRADALERKEQERIAAEEERQRQASIKTTDDAKAAAAAAEKRAKDAEKRAEAAEKRIRERIDKRFETLDADTRERIAHFQDRMGIEDWERLVDMEIDRMGASGYRGDASGGTPPAQPAGAGRRNHGMDGRELHPKTAEILDELGVDTTAARKILTVDTEKEGGVVRGRFIYPANKLRKHIRERALQPVLLSEENRRKLFDL